MNYDARSWASMAARDAGQLAGNLAIGLGRDSDVVLLSYISNALGEVQDIHKNLLRAYTILEDDESPNRDAEKE